MYYKCIKYIMQCRKVTFAQLRTGGMHTRSCLLFEMSFDRGENMRSIPYQINLLTCSTDGIL